VRIHTGYLDPRFVRSANEVREAFERRRLAVWALTHPAAAVRLARVVRRLPTVDVQLSTGPAGAYLAKVLAHRTLGLPTARLARAGLPLPADPSAYLRGRPRQALRTNAARSRRGGVRCAESCAAQVAALVGRADDPRWAAHLDWALGAIGTVDVDSTICVAAVDAAGKPVALAAAVTDERVAYLLVHISDGDDMRSSDARYLIAATLVETLALRGVALLLIDSALMLKPSMAYFQHLLGFAPYNLRVTLAPAPVPAQIDLTVAGTLPVSEAALRTI
jgi:hypothetical protein